MLRLLSANEVTLMYLCEDPDPCATKHCDKNFQCVVDSSNIPMCECEPGYLKLAECCYRKSYYFLIATDRSIDYSTVVELSSKF